MPDSIQQGKDRVLPAAKEQDIRFVSLWFTDILGFLKGFTLTVEELQAALEDGMGFDGSSIEGFARIDESDIAFALYFVSDRFLPSSSVGFELLGTKRVGAWDHLPFRIDGPSIRCHRLS